MGSIDKRLEDLERRIPPPKDEGAELRRAVTHDILNEISRLKSCRSTRRYRGGSPPTPIQPSDPTGEHLGYPYTTGEMVEFAVRRVFERERAEAPDILTWETIESLIASWTEGIRSATALGAHWDEVEMEEPPAKRRAWPGNF